MITSCERSTPHSRGKSFNLLPCYTACVFQSTDGSTHGKISIFPWQKEAQHLVGRVCMWRKKPRHTTAAQPASSLCMCVRPLTSHGQLRFETHKHPPFLTLFLLLFLLQHTLLFFPIFFSRMRGVVHGIWYPVHRVTAVPCLSDGGVFSNKFLGGNKYTVIECQCRPGSVRTL